MVHRIRSRKDGGAPRSKCESDQSLPGNFQIGLGVRGDLHNPALARKRCGYVHVACNIEGQTLRPPQPPVEGAHGTMRINLVYAVEARCGRSGDEQISLWAKSQMISRNTGFERCKNENLLVTRDLENSAAAVAYI